MNYYVTVNRVTINGIHITHHTQKKLKPPFALFKPAVKPKRPIALFYTPTMISLGYVPVRMIGNPCMQSRCSFERYEDKCSTCKTWITQQKSKPALDAPITSSVDFTVQRPRRTKQQMTADDWLWKMNTGDIIRAHLPYGEDAHHTLVKLKDGQFLLIKTYSTEEHPFVPTQKTYASGPHFQIFIEAAGMQLLKWSLNIKSSDRNYGL